MFTNPTMYLSHIPQCTIQNRNVYISVTNGALWDMELVHCGICEIGQLSPAIWLPFLAATKQLYKWYFPSVRPSVCLSVCPSVRHTFLTMFPSSYHHEIFRSYYQWQKWRPCKRSRSEVKGQGHRGHNPTLPFPDCNSSLNSRMMMKWCIQLGSA